MGLHTEFFSLPLKNPVLIFALILLIILFAPLLLNRLRIPQLIGLILAGALIGPHGIHLMERDAGMVLFGTVGLLYIMFLAGLEIDLSQFRQNIWHSFVFGMYTFIIPLIFGILVFYYGFQYSLLSAILISSMFSSHTLVSYPIVSKLGVSKNRAVAITLGGTLITDTLALFVLAIVVSLATGTGENSFWLKLSLRLLLYTLFVVYVFPKLGVWFFKRYDDSLSQFTFVLALVFISGFLAQFAGIEAIVGAFVAGLVLNRLIHTTSPLMSRIEFMGHALFIPFFLLGVGMLIDFSAFLKSPRNVLVAIAMSFVATFSKYLAAILTERTFKYTKTERKLTFGLSNGQAAATLAAVLVGYNIILGYTPDGKAIRLLDESILNGTIFMILVTCTIASFATQQAALHLAEEQEFVEEAKEKVSFLIPVKKAENIAELVNLALALAPKKKETFYAAIHVMEASSPELQQEGFAKKLLSQAVQIGAAADKKLHPILRYDINLVSGIISAVRENKTTDLILGVHKRQGFGDSFFGKLTEGLLERCTANMWLYWPYHKAVTIRQYYVVLAERAEYESGFATIMERIRSLAENTQVRLLIHASEKTTQRLKNLWRKARIVVDFGPPLPYDQLGGLASLVSEKEGLILWMSRRDGISYQSSMKRVPKQLDLFWQKRNFILVFPEQRVTEEKNYALNDTGLLSSMARLARAGREFFKKV